MHILPLALLVDEIGDSRVRGLGMLEMGLEQWQKQLRIHFPHCPEEWGEEVAIGMLQGLWAETLGLNKRECY